MHRALRLGTLLLLATTGVATSGCVTREAVEHAQATADQALSTAQQAQQSADKANAGVEQLNQRMNALEAKHHERG